MPRRKKTVASRMLVRPRGVDLGSPCARWLLRRARLLTYITAKVEMHAALRAGVAENACAVDNAFFLLKQEGAIEPCGNTFQLTPKGEDWAVQAFAQSRALRQDPIPIPCPFLPRVFMGDQDEENLPRLRAEAEVERLSLDDPDVERKFLVNLNLREVRLNCSQLCELFNCRMEEDALRLWDRLVEWIKKGEIVEAEPGIFCRPALHAGATSTTKEPRGAKKRRRRRSDELLRQAERLLAFLRGKKGAVRAKSLIEEGWRHGWNTARTKYLIAFLQEEGKIRSPRFGYYQAVEEATSSATGVI